MLYSYESSKQTHTLVLCRDCGLHGDPHLTELMHSRCPLSRSCYRDQLLGKWGEPFWWVRLSVICNVLFLLIMGVYTSMSYICFKLILKCLHAFYWFTILMWNIQSSGNTRVTLVCVCVFNYELDLLTIPSLIYFTFPYPYACSFNDHLCFPFSENRLFLHTVFIDYPTTTHTHTLPRTSLLPLPSKSTSFLSPIRQKEKHYTVKG